MTSADRTVVLDGGLSDALAERGHRLGGQLWTARLLQEAPGEIAAAHRTYFDAGAEVATTASYQASTEGFVQAGLSAVEAERAIQRSVTLAREVRDAVDAEDPRDRPRLVAASVGPYGAVLADGSEYRGRYGVPAAALRAFHADRLELLAAAGPDLLAVETVPDVDEAAVLVELLADLHARTGLTAWFSYTVARSRTRAGQPLDEAFALVAGCPAVIAVGINCSDPAEVLPALEQVGATGKPGVVYPNRGSGWDAVEHRWIDEPQIDVTVARAWIDAGARFVGGCCQVGPADIAALAAVVHPAAP